MSVRHKVKDHADPDRTDGLCTASVAVLPRHVPTLLTDRRLHSDAVYLALAGTQVTAKQGTVNITIQHTYIHTYILIYIAPKSYKESEALAQVD